jgi:uncharacterized membrane protein YwzB
MERLFLLKAAVCALIPVGTAIAVCFFLLAWFSSQSIRGKDVAIKIRKTQSAILILFTCFIGIFAVVAYALKG